MLQTKLNWARKIRHCFFVAALSSFTFLLIGYLTPRKWSVSSKTSCNFEICIHDAGIHSNIVVPVRNTVFDWNNYLSLGKIGFARNEQYKYLSFGWGDHDFYMQTPTWADLDIAITFRALFFPTPSVMYVQGYQLFPQNLKIKCVKANKNDYLQLMNFINDSFQIDKKGRKIRIGKGHSSNAGFYAAKGSYSLLRNCNTWTAEGLRKADINTPLWDGLSSAIMLHLHSGCE